MSETIVMKAKPEKKRKDHSGCMMNRREFMLYSSAAVSAGTVAVNLFPGTAMAIQSTARVVGYPRKKIAKLSELQNHTPVSFNYPDELKNSHCMLVKLGDVVAGGGVGSRRDIVAFSALCTHQGGPLAGTYKHQAEHRTFGQCPLHLSVYDLRRHGIIVSGQAYESLPQVLLEVDGDDIYAVGMFGLIFGRQENLLV